MGKAVTILTHDEARHAVVTSLARSARAVGASLGPFGRLVICGNGSAVPETIGNGYAIARATAGDGGIAALGARILKETLFDIERDIGDGTATAAVLIDGLVREGLRVCATGIDPDILARSLLNGRRRVLEALDTYRLECDARLLRAAAATASRDPVTARLMSDLYMDTGRDGLIEVCSGDGQDVEVSGGSGMTFDAALVSNDLAADRAGAAAWLANPYFLIADLEIADFGRLVPILEGFIAARKSLVIVSRDVVGPALQTLVRNRRNRRLHVTAVKVNDVLQRGFAILEDIAIATGAELISDLRGTDLSSLRPSMLGRGDEFALVAGQARILGPKGDEQAVERRRAELRCAVERERYLSYDREHLQRRLARMAQGYRRVAVGAPTKPEQALRILAARRCSAAVRLAARDGVVPGGGAPLAKIARGLCEDRSGPVEDLAGLRVMAKGLRAIPAHLMRNAGLAPSEWLGRVEEAQGKRQGLDLTTRRVVDLVAAGIVDPSSTVKEVVTRGVSAAATLLRASAAIA